MPTQPRLELAPAITRYAITRPVNAYPKLPVHVNRVVSYQKFDYDDMGKAFVVGRERTTWIGSFATQELAEGAIIRDRERRANDVL